jgi:hypothetical protein
MCILLAEIVKNIIDKHRTNSLAFSTMNLEDFVHNLTLLFEMHITQSLKKNSTYYTIGNVCKRLDGENILYKSITFKSETLSLRTHDMTLKYPLFPFLFPHRHR